MTNRFFSKMAWSNIKRNRLIYFPFIITGIITITLFYIVNFLAYNQGLKSLPRGANTIGILMIFGSVIMAIFSLIFLFYINSFLIKQRQKELGLYSILGLNKIHLSRVLFFETFYVIIICLICGLLLGIIFSKLILLVVLHMVKVQVPVAFEVSLTALLYTITLFIVIFLLTLIYNLSQVQLTNPITLLKGNQMGNIEPKANKLLGLLGLILLTIGYAIANLVDNPLTALFVFFIAVLLVIVATYLIFTSSSIMILKRLKQHKRFYYKPDNFISISGLLYRMKQNAVGLANICILSTMVIVTLSTTASLYFGSNDSIKLSHPFDLSVYYSGNQDLRNQIELILNQQLSTVPVTEQYRYDLLSLPLRQDQQHFTYKTENYEDGTLSRMVVLSLSDYLQLTQENITLNNDEVLFYSLEAFPYSSITFNDLSYKIKQSLTSIDKLSRFIPYIDFDTDLTSILIVPDSQDALNILANLAKDFDDTYLPNHDRFDHYIKVKINTDGPSITALKNQIQSTIFQQTKLNIHLTSQHEILENNYVFNGSFLFIGIFLGLVFIIATALIIYYKQISEGYQDNQRFLIMKKVGMSDGDIKRTIKKQTLLVFFLPLLTATIHTVFAFKLMTKILKPFQLTNISLFASTTLITILAFSLLYALIYRLTATKYYRLVNQSTF